MIFRFFILGIFDVESESGIDFVRSLSSFRVIGEEHMKLP